MKIAFLSRYQHTLPRGAEVFVKELSERLGKHHQVEVLAGNRADSLNHVLSGNYDLVIPVNGRGQSLKIALGRVMARYKTLISGHSGKGRDDIWNIAVCRPDVFVALTDDMFNWAKKWAWGSRVVKISNGIDLNKFNPKGETWLTDLERPIILSVGALTWYKHHEKVIEAISWLKKGSLLIVGKGEEKEKLKQLMKQKLGLRGQIIAASYEQMPSIYRTADVFTLPSWSREAFGLVYLEALASNIPVVAPDDLSRKEIVGNGGILVNVDNSELYSQAIKEAFSIKWNNRPREQAEKFAWNKIADQYEKVIEETVR